MRLPLTVWGIFTATVMALLVSPLVCRRRYMLLDRLLATILHAVVVELGEHLKYGGAVRSFSSTCSGSSDIPRSISSPCRPSASFPT